MHTTEFSTNLHTGSMATEVKLEKKNQKSQTEVQAM